MRKSITCRSIISIVSKVHVRLHSTTLNTKYHTKTNYITNIDENEKIEYSKSQNTAFKAQTQFILQSF